MEVNMKTEILWVLLTIARKTVLVGNAVNIQGWSNYLKENFGIQKTYIGGFQYKR